MAVIGRLSSDVGIEQASLFYRDTLVQLWRSQGHLGNEEPMRAMVAGSLRDWLLGPWPAEADVRAYHETITGCPRGVRRGSIRLLSCGTSEIPGLFAITDSSS